MVLKKIKDPILIYNHGSQKNKRPNSDNNHGFQTIKDPILIHNHGSQKNQRPNSDIYPWFSNVQRPNSDT
jgi:hypothetical protein